MLLEVQNLHAEIHGKAILKGVSLCINPGEVHAIMGPNGSGKSTLSKAIAGHPDVTITGGSITFEGQDLLAMDPDERARAGVFLAFQYPVEIPGVNNAEFLRMAANARRKHQGQDPLDAEAFDAEVKQHLKLLEMDARYLYDRSVNAGFSGGEKKRNEILQMAVLNPRLAILDETDSGLDIDALRVVAGGVNKLMTPEKACLVITHYQRLLNYIVPDVVHVLAHGQIMTSGGKELALKLEEHGYDAVLPNSTAGVA
jgi:Fe-S cluster assembly ATP-binding protein